MQLQVQLHPHLLPGHAAEDPGAAGHVGADEHGGEGGQVLAALHPGGGGVAGGGAADCLQDLQDTVHRVSVQPPVSTYQRVQH